VSYRIEQSRLGRWIIVNAQLPRRAWSGSRWVEHVGGIGVTVQVSNFETEEEADRYARETLSPKEASKESL